MNVEIAAKNLIQKLGVVFGEWDNPNRLVPSETSMKAVREASRELVAELGGPWSPIGEEGLSDTATPSERPPQISSADELSEVEARLEQRRRSGIDQPDGIHQILVELRRLRKELRQEH